MKRANLLLVIVTLFIVPFALQAVPQVAVLDAVLAAGIDPTVAAPITDKIIEELVNSRKFTIIDRANVEKVLREKEFQLSSGIVRNEEVRRAGEYLGADFVVVANVSRVGSTYVISAKMIDVVSGEIAAQASAEKEGKIDVVLQLARTVGLQISGQTVAAPATTEKKPAAPPVAATPLPSAQNPAAMAQMQALIRSKGHMKPVTKAQMAVVAQGLSDNDRTLLYASNQKDNAGLALGLNILLPAGVGSFIQGDTSGGLTGLLWMVTGVSSMLAGVETDYWGYTYYNGLYYVGVAIVVADAVYVCVRPFRFQKLWNRNLAEALGVPYVSVLDWAGSGLSLQPGPAGIESRVHLNLLSLQY
jgi:TolB-like protein